PVSGVDWADSLAKWNARSQNSDGTRTLEDAVRDRIVSIEDKLPKATALSFDSAFLDDTLDTEKGTFKVRLDSPVTAADISSIVMVDGDLGPPLASPDAILKALSPMIGGLWRADEIKLRLDDLYDPSVVLHTVGASAAFSVVPTPAGVTPRSITITEGFRIA